MTNAERQRKFRASRRGSTVPVLGAGARVGLRPAPPAPPQSSAPAAVRLGGTSSAPR